MIPPINFKELKTCWLTLAFPHLSTHLSGNERALPYQHNKVFLLSFFSAVTKDETSNGKRVRRKKIRCFFLLWLWESDIFERSHVSPPTHTHVTRTTQVKAFSFHVKLTGRYNSSTCQCHPRLINSVEDICLTVCCYTTERLTYANIHTFAKCRRAVKWMRVLVYNDRPRANATFIHGT